MTAAAFVWKGKAREDGDCHLVSAFEEILSGSQAGRSFEAGLCGIRPADKGPMLSAPSGARVTCRGCRKMYKTRTGREWKEPPL